MVLPGGQRVLGAKVTFLERRTPTRLTVYELGLIGAVLREAGVTPCCRRGREPVVRSQLPYGRACLRALLD
jgi:hypothetical protein